MPNLSKQIDEFYQLENEKFRMVGESIGMLVDKKNKAYGDSFNKGDEFLKLLYPNGVSPSQYRDLLYLIRVFDKQMRIATDKDALGENPAKDIAGYSILKVGYDLSRD